MISLVIPPKDQVSRIAKMLADEYGTASNIKSRVNRSVIDVLMHLNIHIFIYLHTYVNILSHARIYIYIYIYIYLHIYEWIQLEVFIITSLNI
jgi:hypothetical protein